MLKTIISASAASVLALTAGTAIAQTTAAPETAAPTTTAPTTTAPTTAAPATAATTHQGHRGHAATTAQTAPTVSGSTTTTTTTTAPRPADGPATSEPAPSTTTPVDATAPTDPAAQPPRADAGTAAPAGVAAPAGTIAAAVAANADLSTLEGALTAADVASTLAQPGPFTVFAPTNEAFNLIAANTRTALMDPANRQALATILKFHVVQGNLTADALRQQIQAGGGTAQLQTVAGQPLTATLEGNNIVLTGQNNSKAYITSADNAQSNGTVHVVNGILVPQLG
jgi:uncharacterized surface protein with fasciclin (FAS1) repeats